MSFYSTDNAAPLGPSAFLSREGAVTDAELAVVLRGYKRLIASNYRALTPEVVDRFIPPGDLLVSPKIDGELWFLIVDGDEVALANPKTRVIWGGLPVLDEARELLVPRVQGLTVIAGELWAAARVGRARVGDVGSARSGGENAEVKRLAFTPFDLIKGGDSTARMPIEIYADRLAVLQRLTAGGKRCRAVRTETVSGAAEVDRLFDEWVASGKTEGLVVRPPDGRIFKVKPSIHVDAVVIGYTGRSEDPAQVRSMLLALVREEGQLQVLGSLGNLGEEDRRRELMTRLEPLARPSSYRHASNDGALYRFVEPQLVVEFKVSDIQSEDSSGDLVQRMILRYEDGQWHAVRKMPGVSILHPVMVRVRDDKSVTATDVGARQVLDSVAVVDVTKTVEEVRLAPSRVIGRAVYTKETKGQLAVRKLVAWETNKAEADPRYPPYVLHYTDYSPGRKDPLQRTVRVAPSLEALRELWEQVKVDKKVETRGWSLVAESPLP